MGGGKGGGKKGKRKKHKGRENEIRMTHEQLKTDY